VDSLLEFLCIISFRVIRVTIRIPCTTYQISVKIKPLYLIHNTYYLTSNTTRVVQQ
jgi:hypothetical protein